MLDPTHCSICHHHGDSQHTCDDPIPSDPRRTDKFLTILQSCHRLKHKEVSGGH